MSFLLLTIAVFFNTTANVLLKLHSKSGFQLQHRDIRFFLDNFQFFSALALFAVNVIFYYFAVRQISLSVAYPYMVGLSFVLIYISSQVFLGERVHPLQLASYTLILLGISLTYSLGQRGT